MKQFIFPSVEVVRFAVSDIITSSGDGSVDTPLIPFAVEPAGNELEAVNMG